MVVKQCCDSKPEPSQQGNLDEINVGWRYMVFIDTKYNRQGSLDTPCEAKGLSKLICQIYIIVSVQFIFVKKNNKLCKYPVLNQFFGYKHLLKYGVVTVYVTICGRPHILIS